MEKNPKLNIYCIFYYKRLSFEILAPVRNRPRLRDGYTQVNIAQIASDIWQLWDETQFWQKRLISCPQ